MFRISILGFRISERKRGIMPKVTVDENLCIGCGACVNACPKSFKMNEEKHKAEAINPPGDQEEKLREAAENCPANAITVE